MTLPEMTEELARFVVDNPNNAIQASYALNSNAVGMPYYEVPLMGCAAAEDPIFAQFQNDPVIIGPMFRLPEQWLPGAKSVISFFLPFTKEIRDSNRDNLPEPSGEWLHGRAEGQNFLMEVCERIARLLREEGYEAVIPAGHPDFCTNRDPNRIALGQPMYTSTWSERHVAFAAGLGTFSLTKHLITEKGVCGRFGSVITTAPFAPTLRTYTDPYEYCTFCGACIRRCPVDAIHLKTGKDMIACTAFMDINKATYAPRHGCGKCQLSIPCETERPKGYRK